MPLTEGLVEGHRRPVREQAGPVESNLKASGWQEFSDSAAPLGGQHFVNAFLKYVDLEN